MRDLIIQLFLVKYHTINYHYMDMKFYRLRLQLLIYCLVLWLPANASDVLSLLRTDIGDFCITNSSSAISYTLKNGTIKEGTKLIPASPYSCGFEEGERCLKDFDSKTNHWKKVNSLKYENLPIFDERWEGLPITILNRTSHHPLDHSSFKTLLNFSNIVNFNITLSLRATEVQFCCCDGDDVNRASCYCFILQGQKRYCILKKTRDEPPPLIDGVFDDATCVLQSDKDEPLIELKQWRHITLEKQRQNIYLKSIVNENVRTIKQFKDESQIIDIKYLLAKSDNAAYCKVHESNYLRTTYVTKDLISTSRHQVSANNKLICLSFLLTTCEQCQTEVVGYFPERHRKIEIAKGKILPPSHRQWTEHKIEFTDVPSNYFYLLFGFRTITNSSDSDNFWSIDNFRYCNPEEYRVSTRQNQDLVECTLPFKLKRLEWEEPKKVTHIDCDSLDHLGGVCVPYDILRTNNILRLSKKLRICDIIADEQRCYCSPGYTGQSCDIECEGTFGYGCQQKCGYCLGNYKCNKEDGSCVSCNTLFKGRTCHIPKRGIILKDSPYLISSHPNSCVIELFNTDHYGKDEIKYFLVQYQKQTSFGSNIATGASTWNRYGGIRSISENTTIELKYLESSTSYSIRVLIGGTEIATTYLENTMIPFTVCNTTCNAWTKEDINITQENETVRFTIKLSEDKCKIPFPKWTISKLDGSELKSGIIKESMFEVKNLPIFARLKIIIFLGSNEISKEFHTTEGVPSEVENITSSIPSTNSVKVGWEEPEHPNGIIANYTVKYRRIRGKYCTKNFSVENEEIVVSSPFVELMNLSVFSVYQVEIKAFNKKYHSNGKSIDVETLGIDTISTDEELDRVQLSTSKTTQTIAILSLENINCENVQGPLRIILTCNCKEKWCTDYTKIFDDIFTQEKITLKELQPFCTYNCSISFCRSSHCTNVSQESFRTRASYPNNISEVIVFSKGPNFINLRWLPPYPPTGTLRYRIITKPPYWNNIHDFGPKKCAIWQDNDCAELTKGIFYGNTYSIQIQAANKENNTFVDIYQIFQVLVKEEASEPPRDLQTYWFENNTMGLYWKHPNRTNGILRNFEIKLKYDQRSVLIMYNTSNLTESDYKLFYHLTQQDIPSSVDLNIEVFALNTLKSLPATKNDSSYPSFPYLLDSHISISNTTESTISVRLNSTLEHKNDKSAHYLLILVTDPATKEKNKVVKLLETLVNKTIQKVTPLRIAAELDLNKDKSTLLNLCIGNDTRQRSILLNGTDIVNKPLEGGQLYNITILLVNQYKNKLRINSYHIWNSTRSDPQEHSGNAAYTLLLLLLLVPVIVVIIIFRKKISKKIPNVSLEKIVGSTMRNLGQVRSNHEELIMESNESLTEISSTERKGKSNYFMWSTSTNPPNPDEKIHSKPIKVANLSEYTRQAIVDGELTEQHALFPRSPTQPCLYGSLPENKSKNRYNNLIAYDHSRVKLQKLPEDEYSDYINANFIHGYKVPNAFIATQGPKQSTLKDFWRMIWQENVKHIIMLANIYEGGKKKVEQYWPNINEELNIENISVTYISMEVFADFEHRIFHVARDGDIRKLEQLHFTSWPDHGVPLYPQSLVPFIRRILMIRISSSSPIVIHCSAGVGRTGTILLCDICLRMAAKKGTVDMLNNLQKLREQRSNMVDNVEQYKLAHLVVLETLMGLHTSIPCNDIDETMKKVIIDDEYKIQMEYLKETQWQDEAMRSVGGDDENFVIHPEKNRYQNFVPDGKSRILLPKYPSDDASSSYINAIKVDGFRWLERFVVTQQPMPNTLGDFWRLVVEEQTRVIISLNEINLEDETCCQFIPTATNPEIRPTDFMLVTFGKMSRLRNYDIYSVRIWLKNTEQQKFDVEIISFKKWEPADDLPFSCEEFLSFWEEADTRSRRSQTVLVTCYDGRTASGVYVALSFVIEKIKLEQECDVCLAVRTVRHNRKQFISNEKQFLFLYEVALRYIRGFQSYSNFQKE